MALICYVSYITKSNCLFFLNKALKIYLPICTKSNINTPFHNKKSVYNSLTSTTTNYYFYILLLLLLLPSNLYTKLRLILTKKYLSLIDKSDRYKYILHYTYISLLFELNAYYPYGWKCYIILKYIYTKNTVHSIFYSNIVIKFLHSS